MFAKYLRVPTPKRQTLNLQESSTQTPSKGGKSALVGGALQWNATCDGNALNTHKSVGERHLGTECEVITNVAMLREDGSILACNVD